MKKHNFQNFRLSVLQISFFIGFSILFVSPMKVSSQENIDKETSPYLKLTVGLGNYKLRDKVFSPLSYGGTSIPIALQYQTDKSKKTVKPHRIH